jgi:hypothetical protein
VTKEIGNYSDLSIILCAKSTKHLLVSIPSLSLVTKFQVDSYTVLNLVVEQYMYTSNCCGHDSERGQPQGPVTTLALPHTGSCSMGMESLALQPCNFSLDVVQQH